jgi:hypothetical protein
MDRRHNRNLFVVAVAGMFCWFNASMVSAQTATNLDCAWCVGPGEVGWSCRGVSRRSVSSSGSHQEEMN